MLVQYSGVSIEEDSILGLFEKPKSLAVAKNNIDQVNRYNFGMMREWSVKRFGFSVPCTEAVERLKGLSPLVEVGAGSGYWAKILRDAGADIIATDIGQQSGYSKLWVVDSVERMSADDAIAKWPERNVFVSWPSYDMPWAREMVEKIRPGKMLAYIGEARGGCTADNGFFEVLSKQFEMVETVRIPQWPGIHDELWILRRT